VSDRTDGKVPMTVRNTTRGSSFVEESHRRHASHFALYGAGGERADRTRDWMRDDTIDAWRHRRMYHFLDPLIETLPGATWLTVGDGRLASDARYLQSKGADVLATDISDTLGEQAVGLGYVSRFQQENAESLSFETGSFDFVVCKESYHHFPRPWLAVYEMLRVARVAVVMIEPRDITDRTTRLESAYATAMRIRDLLLRRRRPPVQVCDFEETGNFKYPLSREETVKVALGLNLPHVAFAGLDDRYLEEFSTGVAESGNPSFRKVHRTLRRRDLLARLGLVRPDLLVAAIFLCPLSDAQRKAMTSTGYEVLDLPRNPYLDDGRH
jgi:SAM-dependent methyltransferase